MKKVKKSSNSVQVIDLDEFDLGEDDNTVFEPTEVVNIHETRSGYMGVSFSIQEVPVQKERLNTLKSQSAQEGPSPEISFLDADVFCDEPADSSSEDDAEEQMKVKTPKQRVRSCNYNGIHFADYASL